jgi:hypothetical protein
LILCALMNLTISAPSINLSISMLFRSLHILSILTGPNIVLSLCLSKMCRLFSSFVVKVQVSDESVRTGLIIVLYSTCIREIGKYKYVLRVTYQLYWTEDQRLLKSVTWFASRTKLTNEKYFKTLKRVTNNLTGVRTILLPHTST